MSLKLIVGLGNIGQEFENTRHNVGFMVIDQILINHHLFLNNNKFNGVFVKTNVNGEDVILAKPYTFMNLSGNFVRQLADFFKVNIEHILVIYDDMDTDIGSLKLKKKGSSGGHKGIKSIIDSFGSENIKRLKIGISHPNKLGTNATIDYVIGKFNSQQQPIIKNVIVKAANACNDFLTMPFDALMSKYNC